MLAGIVQTVSNKITNRIFFALFFIFSRHIRMPLNGSVLLFFFSSSINMNADAAKWGSNIVCMYAYEAINDDDDWW